MKYGTCLLIISLVMAGCTGVIRHNLPPAERIMHPGPGVGGPGPGVIGFQPSAPVPQRTSQVLFVGPQGMVVQWDVMAPGQFDSEPLVCPGRYNFPQGAIYRLKLTNIPAHPGVELYPTLEVGPAMPRTEAFLAHNAVPVQFSPEDFDQVLSGNFVTKVIYLPDPEYQELALAGVETLVSTRLEPGVDPIQEADRRGSIMAVVRLGNKDLEVPEEAVGPGDVVPAAFAVGQQMGGPVPMGPPLGAGPITTPVDYISGVTGPQYGMPMSGTPIGLPGPPHVPLGAPASLQSHVMRNYTSVHMPSAPSSMRIHVRQDPGFSYPRPANKAFIVEQTSPGLNLLHRPLGDYREVITPDASSCPVQ